MNAAGRRRRVAVLADIGEILARRQRSGFQLDPRIEPVALEVGYFCRGAMMKVMIDPPIGSVGPKLDERVAVEGVGAGSKIRWQQHEAQQCQAPEDCGPTGKIAVVSSSPHAILMRFRHDERSSARAGLASVPRTLHGSLPVCYGTSTANCTIRVGCCFGDIRALIFHSPLMSNFTAAA